LFPAKVADFVGGMKIEKQLLTEMQILTPFSGGSRSNRFPDSAEKGLFFT